VFAGKVLGKSVNQLVPLLVECDMEKFQKGELIEMLECENYMMAICALVSIIEKR